MKAAISFVLLLLGPVAWAIDARDSRGLAVTVERIAEPLLVDGLAMNVQRAQGPDVGVLAQRIQGRWRVERSRVEGSEHNAWQIRSRWTGLHSEVIQWRGVGKEAELLFSRFDVSRRPDAPAAVPVGLPPQCRWVRSVEGRAQASRYLQLTAQCRIAIPELVPRLEASLVRHDWTVVHRNGLSWHVARREEAARLTLIPFARPGEAAMVWVTTLPDADP